MPTVPAGLGRRSGEARLKRVIESLPVGLIVTSHTGAVLAANREALTLLAVDRLPELVGGNLDAWVAGEDRERFRQFVTRVSQGEPAELEYRIVCSDGATRVVETRAVPLSHDGPLPASCLSATWEVREHVVAAAGQQEVEPRALPLAQRETYEAALRRRDHADDQVERRYPHRVLAER